MCLVEEPAVYKDVTRTVVKTPATTREVVVPAEYQVVRKQVVKTPATTRARCRSRPTYQTIRKQVVKTPAQTREVPVPAEYRTVKVTKLADPAREVRTPIPAEYQTVEKTQEGLGRPRRVAFDPVRHQHDARTRSARSSVRWRPRATTRVRSTA
jgi:hypothetical protein